MKFTTNISNMIAALSSSLKTVGVQFKDAHGDAFGKVYTYKTDLELEVGSEVIVDSPSSGLTIAIVTEVHSVADINLNVEFSYKWIVGKVDVEAHQKRLENEAELYEEFAIVQQKVNKMRMVEELKKAMGFSPNDSCEEVDALLKKINAQ